MTPWINSTCPPSQTAPFILTSLRKTRYSSAPTPPSAGRSLNSSHSPPLISKRAKDGPTLRSNATSTSRPMENTPRSTSCWKTSPTGSVAAPAFCGSWRANGRWSNTTSPFPFRTRLRVTWLNKSGASPPNPVYFPAESGSARRVSSSARSVGSVSPNSARASRTIRSHWVAGPGSILFV